MEDIAEIFKNKSDTPTVIFDLKGPIPRVSKIGNSLSQMEVKKDQLIRIVHENPKIEESDVIQVYKKIANFIEVGDKIIIDPSNCSLRVISVGRYKKRLSIKGFKSMEKLYHNPPNNTFDLFDDNVDEYSCKLSFNDKGLDIIDERDEEREDHHIDDYVDLSLEERLKQRETSMRKAYQNILKKHVAYSELDRINELDRIHCDSDSSCKIAS
jgi:hypothetical protein